MTTASRAFPALLTLVTGVVCATVVGGARLAGTSSSPRPAPAAAPHAAPCAKAPLGPSLAQAWNVANLFIEHAVLRDRPECSYELLVPGLRHGLSRADFAAGRVPLASFHTAFPKIARTTTIRVALPRQLGLWVFLEAPDVGRRVYELVIVQRGGRWLVDYWGQTADPTDPPFPADLMAPAAPAGPAA
jgi:hypothetical protein